MATPKKAREEKAGHYRKRAAAMLKKSREMASDEAKNVFLALAENWDRMAQRVERPNQG